MDPAVFAFAVAIILGSVMLLSVSWVYVKHQTYNLGGSLLTVFGVVLVGMPVWSVINISVSQKGVEAKLQRIENRVDTAEKKATSAEQVSTEVRNTVSQLTDTLRAQHALSELGLYNGPADGVPGPQTMAAIRTFQASKRLSVTGNLDKATMSALPVQR